MGHPAVKQGSLQLYPEKIRIVGVQRGINVGLHCGQIDAVVFKAWMVAHHQKAERCK